MRIKSAGYGLVALIGIAAGARGTLLAGEWLSNIRWDKPAVVEPGEGTAPPSDAIVLFDGKDMSPWRHGDRWLVKDGYAESRGGGIETEQGFGSCQLHLEFASPSEVEGQGQGRGNSGVYFMKRYEVQILDSYNNETYHDGQCGAIYKQSPPLVNASRPPGEWQTYDIIFTAPKFDEVGKVVRPATLTVLHNGVLIQNHYQLRGDTKWHTPPSYQRHADKLPIHLQFHGDKVRFRNIWVRELPEKPDPWDSWDPSQAKQT